MKLQLKKNFLYNTLIMLVMLSVLSFITNISYASLPSNYNAPTSPNLAIPLRGGAVIHDTKTISTASVTILAANGARKFLQIQNVGAANNLACTLDGTTPVINGNGIQLSIGGSATYDVYVPTGAIKCIGSAAGTKLTVVYQL